jgi:hypothetical protein
MKATTLPLICAALLLSACGRTPPPEPIKVMVPVPCIATKPTKPVYPEAPEAAGLFERVQTLLAERELRMAYEGQLEAALSACD